MENKNTPEKAVKGGDAEVNQRVTHIFELLTTNKGYLQEDIARALNIRPSGLTRIKKGQQNATARILTGLTEQYGVNPSYLLKGEGEPFSPSSTAVVS